MRLNRLLSLLKDNNMELRQLKYFLKAQELLSFTEAAQSLYISQSTLSQQIKQLEIELDVILFDRSGRNISLTEAGRLFIPFAEQSVQSALEGKLMIGDLKGVKAGSLRIGVAYGLKNFLLNVLINFAQEFPLIDIKIVFGPSHSLFESLMRNEIDFVFAFHEGETNPHFSYQQLFSSAMVLVSSVNSPLSSQTLVTMKEIAELPLIIATQDFDRNHIVYKSFSIIGLNPRFVIEVNDIQSAIDLIRSGNWYTILVESSLSGTGLKSIPISDGNLDRNAKIVSVKDRYDTNAAKEFKKQLRLSLGSEMDLK